MQIVIDIPKYVYDTNNKKCVYECVKVVLNGKVVFNKYDEGVEPQESEDIE